MLAFVYGAYLMIQVDWYRSIYIGIYIWKYLVYCFQIYTCVFIMQPRDQIFILVYICCGVSCNEFSVGTLTTKRVA
jgi:hypothetical protein